MKLTYLTSGRREKVLLALLSAGHIIEEIIATDPIRRPNVAETISLARQKGIPVHIINGKSDVLTLSNRVAGRTCISVGFAYILPPPVIDAAALILNVHGSLLPKYAGARTGNWIIANGESETGVTVHKIDVGVDTGPILLQRAFQLDPLETAMSLARKLADFEPKVVVEALSMLEKGNAIFRPQPTIDAIRWPDRLPQHSEIDPDQPLRKLVQDILACDPDRFPAFFYYKGRKVCVRIWPSDSGDG